MASIRSIRLRAKRAPGPIGNRCKDYAEGCAICEAHRFKDLHGRFPYSYDELENALKQYEALREVSRLTKEIGQEL